MILGFSHAVRNCLTLDHEMVGRAPVFRERLKNDPSKWPLMKAPQEYHELALCYEGISVEYVSYDRLSFPNGLFAIDGEAVVLSCGNAEKVTKLWRDGIGLVDHGGELRFKSPISAWKLRLRIVEAELSRPTIDCVGVSMLSFLTTSIESERVGLAQAGAELLMSPFNVRVHGKDLVVEILRGPGNEFIELIQVLP